jgi:hypothetical protein
VKAGEGFSEINQTNHQNFCLFSEVILVFDVQSIIHSIAAFLKAQNVKVLIYLVRYRYCTTTKIALSIPKKSNLTPPWFFS